MPDRQTFIAFSCPHCPLQDEKAVDWLIGRIEAERPDVIVHLGDGHEADSASRWPSEYTFNIVDEWKAHNALLGKIRKASPKSRRVFLPGNHDANFSAVGRIQLKLAAALDYAEHEPELKEHWERPCPYVYDRRRGVFRLGQVSFGHGWESGVNSDEFQAILLAMPYGLHVSGHTHRPLPVTRCFRTRGVPLPFWYANAGCIRDLSPQYMSRHRSHGWGQAMVIGEVAITKSPRMSRQWEARTEVFRMKDEGEFD
jgi:predicted phosphodiesterase